MLAVLPEEPSPVAIEKEEKEVVAPVPISPPTVAPLPLMKIPKIKIRLANPTSEERDSNKVILFFVHSTFIYSVTRSFVINKE